MCVKYVLEQLAAPSSPEQTPLPFAIVFIFIYVSMYICMYVYVFAVCYFKYTLVFMPT